MAKTLVGLYDTLTDAEGWCKTWSRTTFPGVTFIWPRRARPTRRGGPPTPRTPEKQSGAVEAQT